MNLSYKKGIIKTAVFSVIFLSGVAFICGDSYFKKQSKLTQTQENVENYSPQKEDFLPQKQEKLGQNKNVAGFIIKEYNGSVAVFENGKISPLQTTETRVADLPMADRELLKKGINVCGKEELSRVLEDYCS